jgi:RNA polymerase sigma-70 factor, ECF subfamily
MNVSARPNRRAGPDSRDEPLYVERAKAGDREAFSQLVRMHQAVVRAYLSTHVRGTEAADDLAQEVFLRAFRRLDTFQLPETGSIRPWLLGIARNLLLEQLRAPLRVEARRPSDLEAVIDGRQLQIGGSPRDPMEVERRIEALQRCVDQLAPPAFALVWRHYFERRTLASLAAEEKRQESALRMRLLRIREALRACIEQTTGEGARP